MAVAVAAVLTLGLLVEPLIITAFLAVVAGLGVSELVTNAAKIQNLLCKILSAVYTASMISIFSQWSQGLYSMASVQQSAIEVDFETVCTVPLLSIIITLVYVIACAVIILIKQEEFDLSKIAVLVAAPLLYAFAFSTLGSIINTADGIYYLLLMLNFACICDMGAYFVGVSLGRRKLCPAISPNKTVEGAIGGILSAVLVSVIIVLCFGKFDRLLVTLALTIPLCVAGMLGDLFASIIKRKAEIKDYGSLIPGHGGILDRVDSLLFIAPAVYCLVMLGVL